MPVPGDMYLQLDMFRNFPSICCHIDWPLSGGEQVVSGDYDITSVPTRGQCQAPDSGYSDGCLPDTAILMCKLASTVVNVGGGGVKT